MKRVLSVFLAAVMCLLPLAVCVYAADDDMPADVCYVTLPTSYMYTVEPCEGYDQYVVKGESFQFRVTPNDGYSLDMVMVYYYPTDITDQTTTDEGYFKQEPFSNPDSNVYTIDSVNTDITISVEQVLQQNDASFFRTLMEFIHMIFVAIGRLFGFDVDMPF